MFILTFGLVACVIYKRCAVRKKKKNRKKMTKRKKKTKRKRKKNRDLLSETNFIFEFISTKQPFC